MRTLPGKERLILTSVFVGFFVSVAAVFTQAQFDERVVYGPHAVCAVETVYPGKTEENNKGTETEQRTDQRITLTTEEHVRNYFSDIPIMVDIARCESNFRHFNVDGSVLRGNANQYDIGVMQINKFYHGTRASQLGIDIFSREGNMAYARYLYENQGTSPWRASYHCWGLDRDLAHKR